MGTCMQNLDVKIVDSRDKQVVSPGNQNAWKYKELKEKNYCKKNNYTEKEKENHPTTFLCC